VARRRPAALARAERPRAARDPLPGLPDRRAARARRRLLPRGHVLLPARCHEDHGGTTVGVMRDLRLPPRRLTWLLIGGLVAVYAGARILQPLTASRLVLTGAARPTT